MTPADWEREQRAAISASLALADENRRRDLLATRKAQIAQNADDEAGK